jgi:hypothetical protein
MEATAKAFYAGCEYVGLIVARFSNREGEDFVVMETVDDYPVILPEFLIEAL